MIRFIVKRIIMLVPILLCVSILLFVLMSFTPGDPAKIILGMNATEEKVAALREEMGLNKSLPEKYFTYMKNIVTRLDFGTSYITGRSVTAEIFERLPYTLLLAGLSMIFSILFGIPMGFIAATNQNTWKDNASMFISMFFLSMPAFWFALVLVMIFSIKLRILPVVGVSSWKGYILPVISLALGGAAGIARQARSSMLEVIRQDYVTTARAKGQNELVVNNKHVLRNALIPIIVVVGSGFGMMMGGALIAEKVFSIPGMGSYMVGAISSRDYPVITGGVLVISVCFCLIMLATDIVMALVDPRMKIQFMKK
jgi:peptide/nickel transport system permease protein